MERASRSAVIAMSDYGFALALGQCFHESGRRVTLLTNSKAPTPEPPAGAYSQFKCDFADEISIATAIGHAEAPLSRIDTLVTGYLGDRCATSHYAEIDGTTWDSFFATNLRSVWLCTKHALAGLRRADLPSIVLIASTDAVGTSKDRFSHAVVSGALMGLTRTLALELAPDRIRVNAVMCAIAAPTKVRGKSDDEDHPADVDASTVPLGTLPTTSDVAPVVEFLASKKAAHMTGSVIVVDGGISVRIKT